MSLLTTGTAENIVAALLAVLSFTLFVIAIVAFFRKRNLRIGLIAVSFLLFFIEGLLFSVQLFYLVFTSQVFYTLIGLMSVVILIFIFAATFKR